MGHDEVSFIMHQIDFYMKSFDTVDTGVEFNFRPQNINEFLN